MRLLFILYVICVLLKLTFFCLFAFSTSFFLLYALCIPKVSPFFLSTLFLKHIYLATFCLSSPDSLLCVWRVLPYSLFLLFSYFSYFILNPLRLFPHSQSVPLLCTSLFCISLSSPHLFSFLFVCRLLPQLLSSVFSFVFNPFVLSSTLSFSFSHVLLFALLLHSLTFLFFLCASRLIPHSVLFFLFSFLYPLLFLLSCLPFLSFL